MFFLVSQSCFSTIDVDSCLMAGLHLEVPHTGTLSQARRIHGSINR